MAEPPRAKVLANMLQCLETAHQLADASIPSFTSKLFGVIEEWKSLQQQYVDAEAHCLSVLEGLQPTPEELIPFEGVRSRLLQAIPTEIRIRRGILQLEYKEIREEDSVSGATALALLASGVRNLPPFNTDETVAQSAVPQSVNHDTVTQVAVDETVTQAAVDERVVPANVAKDVTPLVRDIVDRAAPQLAVESAVPRFAHDDTVPQAEVGDTTLHSNVDENVAQLLQANVDDTALQLDMEYTIVPSAVDQNVTPLVQDKVVPTVAQDVTPTSSALSIRDKTPTPPSTLLSPLPVSPLGIVLHAQEPSDFSPPVLASEGVVETQGRSSFDPTVPTTGNNVEAAQGQDPEADYDTTHLYDATPPRAPRASPVTTPPPAAPDLSEDELALDNNTTPAMNTSRARAGTAVTRRMTRASRASNEPLWGSPNANSGPPPMRVPPTPTALATGAYSSADPPQVNTKQVRFAPGPTRSAKKSSKSQPLQSTINTSSQPRKGAGDSVAPKPTKATAKSTTSQARQPGSSANTRRPKGAELQPKAKVIKLVTKGKAKAKPQPGTSSNSGSSSGSQGIKGQKGKVASRVVTKAKASKSAAKNTGQGSKGTEAQQASSGAKTVEKSTPAQQPTTKTKSRQSQGAEVTSKLPANAAKVPKIVVKSGASQRGAPVAGSSTRRPQVGGPASQVAAAPKTAPRQAVHDTGGTREMTTTEVEKGRYWVFEHGSTKRRVKLYVLRCPNRDCKNPVFSRHPFKQNRAVEHLRGCTNFRMENATEERIIARFAHHVYSDPTSGPVTREWACRHNSTLIPKTRRGEDLRVENVWEDVEEEEDELAR